MITGKLNLAALTHVKQNIKSSKTGQSVKCLVIPIEGNKLFEGKEGAVYLDIVAFPMKEPKDYGTHIIKQSFSKDVREGMSEEEKTSQPILGNLKADGGGQRQEANNDAGGGKEFEEGDDLPF